MCDVENILCKLFVYFVINYNLCCIYLADYLLTGIDKYIIKFATKSYVHWYYFRNISKIQYYKILFNKKYNVTEQLKIQRSPYYYYELSSYIINVVFLHDFDLRQGYHHIDIDGNQKIKNTCSFLGKLTAK